VQYVPLPEAEYVADRHALEALLSNAQGS